jgi:hypothetical protein
MRLVALACGLTLMLCAPAAADPLPPVLDQSFTSPGNGGAVVNECCQYVGQTFTAGRDGVLAGVNVDTYDATLTEPNAPLRVAIHSVENGVPTQRVLAETVLPSETIPLSQLITFPQTARIRSGVQYAIVVNLEDPFPTARAGWAGSADNPYPRGDECILLSGAWSCYTASFDLHFQTFLRPTREQARQACVFERAAIGRPAFRDKYGTGAHRQHAMRNCIRERLGG